MHKQIHADEYKVNRQKYSQHIILTNDYIYFWLKVSQKRVYNNNLIHSEIFKFIMRCYSLSWLRIKM